MEISPQTFRDVEFREKRHGYHPEDVDKFLEQMEQAVGVLQDRLSQALDRAERSVAGGDDDEGTIRRTLVLAQRTADLAVSEAHAEATSIVAAAQRQAEALLAEADQRASHEREESQAATRSELAQLEVTRAQAQEEVELLHRWAAMHRSHFATMLQDAATALERVVAISPAPSSLPIEAAVDLRPPSEGVEDNRVLASVPSVPAGAEETQALLISEHDDSAGTQLDPPERNLLTDPDEGKLDTFFAKKDQEADDHRLGGRLRRRS